MDIPWTLSPFPYYTTISTSRPKLLYIRLVSIICPSMILLTDPIQDKVEGTLAFQKNDDDDSTVEWWHNTTERDTNVLYLHASFSLCGCRHPLMHHHHQPSLSSSLRPSTQILLGNPSTTPYYFLSLASPAALPLSLSHALEAFRVLMYIAGPSTHPRVPLPISCVMYNMYICIDQCHNFSRHSNWITLLPLITCMYVRMAEESSIVVY